MTAPRIPCSYSGLRATILGLGTFGGGVAAARFLAERGAVVSITDLRNSTELHDSLNQLRDVALKNVWLGEHPPAAFDNCDLLVVNPAIKPGHSDIEACRSRGVTVTSEIELFLHHNVAPVISVTGSNGKSTTTALIHHLMQVVYDRPSDLDASREGEAPAEPPGPMDVIHGSGSAGASPSRTTPRMENFRRAWLGGNIGHSLLPDVDRITADDVVVLELSSFQLEQLREMHFAPQVAVVTNFSPNHLDWHGTLDCYRTAKQRLLTYQRPGDVAILPDELRDEDGWRTRGTVLRFGTQDNGEDGVFLEGGVLILRRNDCEEAIRLSLPAQLPGRHNALNVAAAACAAWQLGADVATFEERLCSFQPLPHRLQQVADGGGLRFFNDSIATTPESAIAALEVSRPNCVVLAGGYDKGQDLKPLADSIRQHARAVVLMGQTANALASLLAAREGEGPAEPPNLEIRIATDFPGAFAQAVALARPGDIVLLSPGCASYGWFRDYRDRGDQFIHLARQWTASR